jgi:glutamate racemase
MGTRLTIEAGVYQPILMRREPRRVIEIVATATEQAVSYGLINSGAGASAARRELEHYARLVGSPEAVVLGCTCYEFAAAPIRAAFGEQVALLNPADYVAEEVRRLLGIAPTQQPASHAPILLNTGGPEWEATLSLSAEHILGQAVRVHSIDLLRDIDPALSSR